MTGGWRYDTEVVDILLPNVVEPKTLQGVMPAGTLLSSFATQISVPEIFIPEVMLLETVVLSFFTKYIVPEGCEWFAWIIISGATKTPITCEPLASLKAGMHVRSNPEARLLVFLV